ATSAASPTVRVVSPGRKRTWLTRSRRRSKLTFSPFILPSCSRMRAECCLRQPMSDNLGDHPDRNRRKLYGRRKGPKLSARQAGLRRTLLGELAYDPAREPWGQFPNTVQELWLE